jgi:hypothetical protein
MDRPATASLEVPRPPRRDIERSIRVDVGSGIAAAISVASRRILH